MSTEDRKTCQICGRAIKAKNGRIAHHGYQRPGEGYQTSSCAGARELPLQVSDAVLARHVQHVFLQVEKLTAFAIEEIKVVNFKRRIKGTTAFSARQYENVEVTAENFAELKETGLFRSNSIYYWNGDAKNAHWQANYGSDASNDDDTMCGRERARRQGLLKQEMEYHKFQSDRLANNPFKKDYV